MVPLLEPCPKQVLCLLYPNAGMHFKTEIEHKCASYLCKRIGQDHTTYSFTVCCIPHGHSHENVF